MNEGIVRTISLLIGIAVGGLSVWSILKNGVEKEVAERTERRVIQELHRAELDRQREEGYFRGLDIKHLRAAIHQLEVEMAKGDSQ